MPEPRHFLTQSVQLRTDGATSLLRIGGDASINGGHCATSSDLYESRTAASTSAYASASASSRGSRYGDQRGRGTSTNVAISCGPAELGRLISASRPPCWNRFAVGPMRLVPAR